MGPSLWLLHELPLDLIGRPTELVSDCGFAILFCTLGIMHAEQLFRPLCSLNKSKACWKSANSVQAYNRHVEHCSTKSYTDPFGL